MVDRRRLANDVTCTLLLWVLLVPAMGWAAADPRATLESGGRTRTYVVHLPVGYNAAQRWPVLIALHGLLFTPFIGRVSRDLDANRTVWEFFKARSLPAAAAAH